MGRTLRRTPLADAVGVLLAGDLAPRLLDNFDFYELALASRVGRRWRDAAVRLELPRRRDFMTKPGAQSHVAEFGARFDLYNKIVTEHLEASRERDAGQINDSTADQLVQLWVQGLNAHVVEDPGTSSAASYVAFVEYLASQNVSGRVLIVAVQDELDKWNAAFQGKAYFCGDLDAQPLRGNDSDNPDSGMLVSVCSEACVRRHSRRRGAAVVNHAWQLLIVDAGASRASTMCGMFRGGPLLLAITCVNRHVVSRSQHVSSQEGVPRGVFRRPKAYLLDLDEAAFRLRFLHEQIFWARPTDDEADRRDVTELWRASDTLEEQYLRWLVQGDFSRRLIADAHAVRVEAQP